MNDNEITLKAADIANEILLKLLETDAIQIEPKNHGIHTPAKTSENIALVTTCYKNIFDSIKETITK